MRESKFEINAANVAKALPEEVLSYLHERYDCMELPTEIDEYCLSKVEYMLATLANERTYLNYMLSVVDVRTRMYRQLKQKEDLDDCLCKKSIIKAYLDSLETMNKALSRMITVYQMEREDAKAEERLANARIS